MLTRIVNYVPVDISWSKDQLPASGLGKGGVWWCDRRLRRLGGVRVLRLSESPSHQGRGAKVWTHRCSSLLFEGRKTILSTVLNHFFLCWSSRNLPVISLLFLLLKESPSFSWSVFHITGWKFASSRKGQPSRKSTQICTLLLPKWIQDFAKHLG